MLAVKDPEHLLSEAVDAVRNDDGWRATLDEFRVPIYTTDAEGLVTYWNKACVEFAGREPQLGSDRWCVTWQIYTTTGEFMPHDECPMAQAIREQRCVRNAVAIAARPDGTRRAFTPYPTPLFDADGSLKGAVNLLIDVTDQQSDSLERQGARCRRLARSTNDAAASEILSIMAKEYDATVASLKSVA